MKTVKTFMVVCFLLSFGLQCWADNTNGLPVFVLTAVEHNSDFDYDLLNNLDALQPPYPKDGNFMIGSIPMAAGNFDLYIFLSPYMGYSSEEPQSSTIFHRLLVIKADKDLNILDAYHYIPEWQDTPGVKLYKATVAGLQLRRNFRISQLKFTNDQGEKLEQDGVLDDFYRGRLLFPDLKSNKAIALTLRKNKLKAENGKILFEPYAGVRRASYTTYFFDEREFSQKVGKLPLAKDKTIDIEILQTENKKFVPDNPMMASPNDGFSLIHHHCRILH